MMERRTFLKTLLGSAAAFVVDPDLKLWIPGAKTIFIPPAKEIVAPQSGIAVATEEELGELRKWWMNLGDGKAATFSVENFSQDEWNMAIMGIRAKLAEEKEYELRPNRIITDLGDRRPRVRYQETSTTRSRFGSGNTRIQESWERNCRGGQG